MNKESFTTHLPTFFLALVCIAFHLTWPDGSGPLQFINHSNWSLQPWRLLTAPLLHTNQYHLLINLAAYLLIYFYSQESLKGWRMPLVTLICGLLSTLGFALSPTPLSSLVGLSGALHGVLVYLAICEWRQSPKLMSITLILVVGKVAWEQLYGASSHTAELIGASVAIWSHLSGVLAGVALAVSRQLFCPKRAQREE